MSRNISYGSLAGRRPRKGFLTKLSRGHMMRGRGPEASIFSSFCYAIALQSTLFQLHRIGVPISTILAVPLKQDSEGPIVASYSP